MEIVIWKMFFSVTFSPEHDALNLMTYSLNPFVPELVDGGAASCGGEPGVEAGLAGRALFQASRQDTAHDDFFYGVGFNACTANGFTNAQCAKLDCADAGKTALKAAHGRACSADDDNAVVGHVYCSGIIFSDYGLNISHKATFTYNNTLNELR